MSTATGFPASALPLGPGVRVLAADSSGLVALEKPAGILAHPNGAADCARSLLTAPFDAEAECFHWNDPASGAARRAWLLHRLDSATSGVILIATAEAVAHAVRARFEQRRVAKKYLAIVLGHPREKRALWRDTIAVQRRDGVARAQPVAPAGGSGSTAESAMRVLRLIPGPPALAAIALEPHTGRTHQLRLQCAQRDFPILGDQNYGSFRRNRELARQFGTDRLFLHAESVALEFSLAGRTIRFAASAPPPPEFQHFLAR